jgi:hypothetical protein
MPLQSSQALLLPKRWIEQTGIEVERLPLAPIEVPKVRMKRVDEEIHVRVRGHDDAGHLMNRKQAHSHVRVAKVL